MAPLDTHLVWDWNGTLLNDLALVVTSTNHAIATVDGPVLTPEQHRVAFRRPVADYYADVLGRAVGAEEFGRLDQIFHAAYRAGLTTCGLAEDAERALLSWSGSQSLLSMWFHDELVPLVDTYGLTRTFRRIDGLRTTVGGDRKAGHLDRHLTALGVDPARTVLIGDSIDDADAAEAVGASCILYTGGFTDPDRLRACGVPVAESLTEAVRLAADH
ncbi:phosphoglycolate phosphatase-like HAD superfamily hydrolase [Micromonospora sp. Llam0]|uniref:HAD family hydrolase n=1 Tax=Micromonospora sp. Llam0 TaxID=2485143 RepID=UPI000F49268D|nr:HAD hydrolase-like protein [Micromonospora sp. Llam0]ROO51355.1 phosphoglycolate phosphatase-like HAD superfamily hydrolase [Micromonospora sp. Llam0]